MLAADIPAVVIEANFRPYSEYDRPVGIDTLITVNTTVPVDVPATAAAVRDSHDR